MTGSAGSTRTPVVLGPGEGRAYEMGPLRAVFKADGEESANRYAISEWWLDPHTRGPGVHQHPDDDVFYILAGTMSVEVGGEEVEATAGSIVVVPGGVPHAFDNRTDEPAGMLNISAPGGFEENMPGIAEWFRERSPEDARA